MLTTKLSSWIRFDFSLVTIIVYTLVDVSSYDLTVTLYSVVCLVDNLVVSCLAIFAFGSWAITTTSFGASDALELGTVTWYV